MALNPFDWLGPGDTFQNTIGQKLTAAETIVPVKRTHHVTGTTAIATITPPSTDGFSGPIYLIADSVFSWLATGNIAAANPTTVVAGQAYGFLYDRTTAVWYPIT